MGQQQLLLVILVTIIVGIATVVAINTFGSAADSANVDAVRQDLASIAASAQGFYMKPAMLGGGGRSFDGSGSGGDAEEVTFHDLAFAGTVTANNTAENENGSYTLSGFEPGEFIIEAVPGSGGQIHARVCPDAIRLGDYIPDPGGEDAIDPGDLAPAPCPGNE